MHASAPVLRSSHPTHALTAALAGPQRAYRKFSKNSLDERRLSAIGPAAAGNLGGIRYRNLPRLDDWLEGRGVSPVVAVDRPDAATELGERAMLGLRLRRGLDRAVATALAASTSARQSAIERHLDAGGLEWRGDRLRITDGALMLADDILSDLV